MESYWERETEVCDKKLSQCHVFCYKSIIHRPGIEHEIWGRRVKARPLTRPRKKNRPRKYHHHHHHHSVMCLTTDSQPLPKRVLHTLRSSASYSNFQYPLVSLNSSSSCLPLLHRFTVPSTIHSIFPSITCFRIHFIRKMRPIQLGSLLFNACRI